MRRAPTESGYHSELLVAGRTADDCILTLQPGVCRKTREALWGFLALAHIATIYHALYLHVFVNLRHA